MTNVIAMKIADHKWTVVIFDSCNQQYQCPDKKGGFGSGPTPEKSYEWSVRPYHYRSRKAALEEWGC